MQSLYYPFLFPIQADQPEAPAVAMGYGRDLALADLAANPDRSPEFYARVAASYVHSTLMSNKARHLRKSLVEHLAMGLIIEAVEAPLFSHKEKLEGLRKASGQESSVWACGMIDIAIGIAKVADGLSRADGYDDTVDGATVQEFLCQYVARIPEHGTISKGLPIVRPTNAEQPRVAQQAGRSEANGGTAEVMAAVAGPVEPFGPIALPPAAAELTVTTVDLIDQWLDAKGGLSRAERSRQGSSARLFVDALGLTETTADRLANIGGSAAARFAQYATGFPLAARGERARIAHIKSFIAFAQSMHIAVPDQDWTHVHD